MGRPRARRDVRLGPCRLHLTSLALEPTTPSASGTSLPADPPHRHTAVLVGASPPKAGPAAAPRRHLRSGQPFHGLAYGTAVVGLIEHERAKLRVVPRGAVRLTESHHVTVPFFTRTRACKGQQPTRTARRPPGSEAPCSPVKTARVETGVASGYAWESRDSVSSDVGCRPGGGTARARGIGGDRGCERCRRCRGGASSAGTGRRSSRGRFQQTRPRLASTERHFAAGIP
jgi:hypothetical protein